MSSEEAISDQISASPIEPPSTVGTDDPLANARCQHCGYSLRGLPENRCPECGTAFDPQEIANSFVALWPRLLMWYLVAYLVRAGFGLPGAWGMTRYWTGTASGDLRLDLLALSGAVILRHGLAIILGPLAVWGLYRRRDWVRRVCIVIFAADCLEALGRLTPVVRRVAAVYDVKYAVSTLLAAISNCSACILPILLILFLVTGLRPHSLIRVENECPPRLQRKSFHPRHDWLLLMVLVLAGLGTARFCYGVHWLSDFLGYQMARLSRSTRPAELVYAALYFVGEIATGICALAAAVRIWRRPRSVRAMLTTLVILFAASEPLVFILAQLFRGRFASSSITDVATSLMLGMSAAGPTLVPLVLLLFALLSLSRTEIDNLAAAKEESK
jgi:hypothetical protein